MGIYSLSFGHKCIDQFHPYTLVLVCNILISCTSTTEMNVYVYLNDL